MNSPKIFFYSVFSLAILLTACQGYERYVIFGHHQNLKEFEMVKNMGDEIKSCHTYLPR